MINRSKWTKSEDKALLQTLKINSFRNRWDLISIELKKLGYLKSTKQIKTRWLNNLYLELIRTHGLNLI